MDVNKLHQALCNSLCFTLPGFHTFTGCDYTASYNRKGKIRPQKLFERSDDVKKKLFLFLKDQCLVKEKFKQLLKPWKNLLV